MSQSRRISPPAGIFDAVRGNSFDQGDLMRVTACAMILIAVTAAACRRAVPPEQWSVTVQPVTAPVSGKAIEPQVSVSSRGVLLSWVEQTDKTATLKFAERTSSGWTPARTVTSGDDWFLSYADLPMVLRLGDGTLVANWLKTTNAQ